MDGKRDSFYDKTYRSLFSYPQMVEELIRDFVQESWVSELDFSTLQKVNTRYVSQYLDIRASDVVYRVKAGDQEVFLYLLLEFQSYIDFYMALKVQTYRDLLYQDLIKQKLIKGKLPYVHCMVLYNGDARWTAPRNISDLIEVPFPGVKENLDQFSYTLIAVNALDMQELSQLKDAVNTLFYVENTTGEEFDRNIERIGEAIQSLSNKELRRELFQYIHGFIKRKGLDDVDLTEIDRPEVKSMLRTNLEEYKKKLEAKAFAEGSAKAKINEKIEIARNMLKEGIDLKTVAKVTGLSEEEVRKIEQE
mgnify:FL=1